MNSVPLFPTAAVFAGSDSLSDLGSYYIDTFPPSLTEMQFFDFGSDRAFRRSGSSFMDQVQQLQAEGVQQDGEEEHYDAKITGLPEGGAKYRVENHIWLGLELSKASQPVSCAYRNLWLPEELCSVSFDEVPEVTEADLYLTARVCLASNREVQGNRCAPCCQREWKTLNKRKGIRNVHALTSAECDEHANKILMFQSGPVVNLSSGLSQLPCRLTCYCRHHSEKDGFLIEFTIRNSKGAVVAVATSVPIMITDDHKRAPKSSSWRQSTYGSQAPALEGGMLGHTTRSSKRKRERERGGEPVFEGPNCRMLKLETGSGGSGGSGGCGGSLSPSLEVAESPDEDFGTHSSLSSSSSSKSATPAEPSPVLTKIIPAEGPLTGGISISLMGNNFHSNMVVRVGPHSTSVDYFSPTAATIVLPPYHVPGPVRFALGEKNVTDNSSVSFTYRDDTDAQLMELALRVIGVTMTGKDVSAREVAMQIVSRELNSRNALSMDVQSLLSPHQGGSGSDNHPEVSRSDGLVDLLDDYHNSVRGVSVGAQPSLAIESLGPSDAVRDILERKMSKSEGKMQAAEMEMEMEMEQAGKAASPRKYLDSDRETLILNGFFAAMAMHRGKFLTALQLTTPTGSTVMHLACQQGYVYLVQWLVSIGSNYWMRDRMTALPWTLAQENQHTVIVSFLRQRLGSEALEDFPEEENDDVESQSDENKSATSKATKEAQTSSSSSEGGSNITGMLLNVLTVWSLVLPWINVPSVSYFIWPLTYATWGYLLLAGAVWHLQLLPASWQSYPLLLLCAIWSYVYTMHYMPWIFSVLTSFVL